MKQSKCDKGVNNSVNALGAVDVVCSWQVSAFCLKVKGRTRSRSRWWAERIRCPCSWQVGMAATISWRLQTCRRTRRAEESVMILFLMVLVSGDSQLLLVLLCVFSWSFRWFSFFKSYDSEKDLSFTWSSTGDVVPGPDPGPKCCFCLSRTEMLQVCCVNRQLQVSSGNLEQRAVRTNQPIRCFLPVWVIKPQWVCSKPQQQRPGPGQASPCRLVQVHIVSFHYWSFLLLIFSHSWRKTSGHDDIHTFTETWWTDQTLHSALGSAENIHCFQTTERILVSCFEKLKVSERKRSFISEKILILWQIVDQNITCLSEKLMSSNF